MTRTMCLALLVSLGLGLAPAATQVRDGARVAVVTGTGQITGRVVTSTEAPAPLRRATVTLIAERDGTRLNAVTDDAGVFAFMSLPADRYALSAAKAKRPGGSGTPVVVSEDQQAIAVIALPRGSVILGAGRVAGRRASLGGRGEVTPGATPVTLPPLVSATHAHSTGDGLPAAVRRQAGR